MATRVAAAGGGNFSVGATWVGGVAPTAADDAQLDATSGNVTIDTTGCVARSLDCTGYTGTLSHTSGMILTLGDATAGTGSIALKFVAGMTYTLGDAASSKIVYASTSATQQTVTTAGKTMGNQTFQGAGSSYLISGSFTQGAEATILSVTAGTFNTGNNTFSIGSFTSTGSTTRTITLGTSTLTLGANAGWTVSGSNVTVSAASSTIALVRSGAMSFSGGGMTYGVLTSTVTQQTSINDVNTFTTITITGGANPINRLTLGADQTISGTLTINGNSAINRYLVLSLVKGTQRTLTAGTLVTQYTDWQDMKGAGTASWNLSAITGLSGDCGGNDASITFTTAVPQFAIGITGAAKVWSDATLWSTSSGGANDGRRPLPQDNATIDANSGAGTKFTIDVERSAKSISFNKATMEFNAGSSTIYGSFTIVSALSSTGSQLTCSGRSNSTISFGGLSTSVLLEIRTFGATYTLASNYTYTGGSTFDVVGGGFDTGNFNMSIEVFASTGSTASPRTITLGTSTITLNRTATATLFSPGSVGGLTFSGASSTLVVGVASSNTRSFEGVGQTYGTLTYTVAGSTGQLTISGSNTFSTINFSDATNARTLLLSAGTTQTITPTGSFNVNGTAGKLMSVIGVTGGAAETISKSGASVICSYLSLQDCTAAGGATFYAGSTSTNVSGNSGWLFSDPVYIVGAAGGGNWSSGASWVGGIAPTAADEVKLTAASGNITIDTTTNVCRSLDCTGYTGTLSHTTGMILSIGDATAANTGTALKLVAGMTYTVADYTATIRFASTSATQQTVATAGKIVGTFTFQGAGSSYLISGSVTSNSSSGTFGHTAGTLDTGNQTISGFQTVSSTGSTTRTLTLGSSAINPSTNWTISGSGLTLTANTAAITVDGSGSPTFAGGGMTYGGTVTVGGASTAGGMTVSGANTIQNLTISGTTTKSSACRFSASQTVSGTFTTNGNSAINRLLLYATVLGTPATITAATVSSTYTDWMDITGAGAGSWNLSAITGNSGDCGGNSGITFTSAITCYAVGITGTAKLWSDSTLWFTTSGGATPARIPLPQDNATIDTSSGAGTKFTLDMVRLCKDLTVNRSAMEIFHGGTGGASSLIFGSITITAALSITGGGDGVFLYGRGTHTLNFGGLSVPWVLQVYAFGGTYTLAAAITLTTSSAFSVENGTFNTGNFNMQVYAFHSGSGLTRAITLGTSTITTTAPDTNFWLFSAAGLTLSAASSTIVSTGTSASTRTFGGGSQTYGTLTYTVAGSTGQLTISGSNTFSTINFSDATNARTLLLSAGTTQTITPTGSFNVNGTAGKLMSVQGVSGGIAEVISKSGTRVVCDYLNLTDCTASGGTSFYAGANSVDNGGNPGWFFTAAPGATTSLLSMYI